MAFTGTAVFAEVSNRVVRITGLSLAATVSGVLGLFGDGTAEIELPDGFQPENYSDIDLAESIEVSFVQTGEAPAAPFVALSLSAEKTLAPFQIEVVNGIAAVSGAFEIWLRFH